MDFDIIYKFISGGDYTSVRPTLDEVISANIIVVSILAFMTLLVVLGKYGIGEKVFGKGKGWKAIIPFYGFFALFQAVGLNPVLSLPIFIPVLGLIPFSIFSFVIAKAFGQGIGMSIASVIFPFITYPAFGFGITYEFQYVKGKNTAFKNDFQTVMPEDLLKDPATPASIMNGSVSGVVAKESTISRAATAAAEQTKLIRKAQEEAAAKQLEQEQKKQENLEKEKLAKQAQDEYRYDIFSDDKDEGPTSSDIDFGEIKLVNGRFQSYVPNSVIEPVQPAPAQTTPIQPIPSQQPAEPIPTQPTPPANL